MLPGHNRELMKGHMFHKSVTSLISNRISRIRTFFRGQAYLLSRVSFATMKSKTTLEKNLETSGLLVALFVNGSLVSECQLCMEATEAQSFNKNNLSRASGGKTGRCVSWNA